jgi:hypothetical protein
MQRNPAKPNCQSYQPCSLHTADTTHVCHPTGTSSLSPPKLCPAASVTWLWLWRGASISSLWSSVAGAKLCEVLWPDLARVRLVQSLRLACLLLHLALQHLSSSCCLLPPEALCRHGVRVARSVDVCLVPAAWQQAAGCVSACGTAGWLQCLAS